MSSVINATTTSGLQIQPDNSGSLQLKTNNGTTAVTIDTSQNVGIGTASPTQKLHVFATNPSILTEGAVPGISFKTTQTGTREYRLVSGYQDAGSISLVDVTASNAQRLLIDSSGNVGIGTSSPSGKLDVTGTVYGGKNGTQGYIGIQGSGDTAHTGYIEFFAPNGTRRGYLGYADVSGSGQFNLWSESSTNVLAFGTNSTERMRIDSSGNLLVNTTTANGTLTVNGGVSADDFVVGRDVTGNKHIASRLIYDRTTAVGANITIDAGAGNYVVRRSTSSQRYKTDIIDSNHGLDDVMKLRSVKYKGINDGDNIFGGLIAEEVHDAGLTEFVQYDEEGRPDALAYGQMVSLAFKAIQEQQTIINDLKARVEILEAK